MKELRLLVGLAGLVFACGAPAFAEGLLQNGDFTESVADDEAWPAGWRADAASRAVYRSVNDDGHSGQHSLRYAAEAEAPAGPVTQSCKCAPNSEYVLAAAFKSDGACLPMVEVYARGLDARVVRLTSAGDKVWTTRSVRFNSGGAEELEVRVFGDVTIAKSARAKVGVSGVDGVQIHPADAVPAELKPKSLFTPPGPNLALGKSYKLQPRPNYGYCTDPDDKTQLTDGVCTVGYFWTQKTTVGWSRANPASVTIDLEQVEPIAGVSYSTAAGVAGVAWPSAILILVSDDGKEWTHADELMQLATKDGAPRPDVYAQHRFATDALKTKGRYVKLMISQTPYCFVDEIEVYRGPDELLANPAEGRKIADVKAFFIETGVLSSIVWRLRTDLAAARRSIADPAIDAAGKAALAKKADALAARIDAQPQSVPPDFRSVLPLNELHAEIYALNAAVLRARGLAPLTVWARNRWDPLAPTQAPEAKPDAAPALRVDAMINEVRADAFNLTNATDGELQATVAISGLPGGVNPQCVSVREVLWTDTRARIPIAAALPEAQKSPAGWRITVPAGLTRQVWLSCRPRDVAPGEHRGNVRVDVDGGVPGFALPFTLCVHPFEFPTQPTLSVGGWDYTNGRASYYGNPGNLEALLDLLRDHYVDTPWGTGAVQPKGGTYDQDGRLLAPYDLDFSAWDQWVDRWAGVRNYYVFLSVRGSFHGEPMGTPRFNRMVGDWMRAWVEHMKNQGLEPGQLGLLLVDEPSKPEQDERILTWAKPIRAAAPEVVIWEDPCHKDPYEGNQEMFAICTTLCPNTPRFLRSSQEHRDFYAAQRDAGRRLWFYSCSGPAKLLDPCHYHRAQKWWAIQYGALGSCYWALGCAGRGTSWNAYAQTSTEYSPFFVGATSVTDGKHMEAIREGVQDYEYFVMLRARVAELEKRGAASPLLDAAKRLLVEGPQQVTREIASETLSWRTPKDRGVMDRVRVEALRMLTKLREL